MRNPRCVITFPVRASGRALESWASLGLLHNLHESAGVEDLQVPLGERRPEFVPANHFDPLVSAFRELDPVRAFYAAWSKPLLLRLLNGGFDAHRFHDQVDPSGTRPHNRPLTDASRGQYIIVVRTRSSRETFYRGALCRNMVRFGSSGIRGLGNVEVTPELALRVGSVIGELYGDSVIGRDPRTTGPMLVQAFAAGVLSTGSAAVDAGLVSTPTLARGARDFACGAMITASHNPAPYNGIKLWNPDGMAFDEAQQREVEEALDRSRFAGPTWDRIGAVFSRSDLVQQHIDAILKAVGTAKVPVDASMVLEDLLPKAKVWRTRVGDVYVAAELKRRGADFGGEPSGTWIFPKSTFCPDGVYAAARLVALVAERPLDDLVREIPRYPVIRGAVSYRASDRAAIETRLDRALRDSGAEVSTVDGWRLQFEDGWALVRFSGTEPKIRILAESREEARAKEIYSAVLSSAKGAAA